MILTDGMLLFHGSYTPVEIIDLSLSSEGKDFGRGFYLTSDLNQAKSFIRSKEWLWFIAGNRRRKLFFNTNHQINDLSKTDVIIGKVANDKTNPVITAYLNGLYGDIMSDEAVDEAIKRLIPDHLVDQYCFLTQKSVECLIFQEAQRYVVS